MAGVTKRAPYTMFPVTLYSGADSTVLNSI